jgi:hypothetical protein
LFAFDVALDGFVVAVVDADVLSKSLSVNEDEHLLLANSNPLLFEELFCFISVG